MSFPAEMLLLTGADMVMARQPFIQLIGIFHWRCILRPVFSPEGERRRVIMRPVVIAVAITGSVPRKKDNPALPVTVPEQIESTQEAFEAGASLVHIHVRNPDESS